MRITELIEQLKAMPEKMEGFNSYGELVVLNTAKLAESLEKTLRNCDKYRTSEEALSAIHDYRAYVNNPIDERRLTVEWLYAEAKGEMK